MSVSGLTECLLEIVIMKTMYFALLFKPAEG